MASMCVTSHGMAVGDGLLSTPPAQSQESVSGIYRGETSWLSLSQTQCPQVSAWPIMDLRIGTLNGINYGCFPFM